MIHAIMPHINSILIQQNTDSYNHFVSGGYQAERERERACLESPHDRPSLNHAAKNTRRHRSLERDDQIRLKLPSPFNRKQTGGRKQREGPDADATER